MTSGFKVLCFGTPSSSQRWFFLLILQAAFKKRVKTPETYLAVTFPRQTSFCFRISPSHSSLTMIETMQILHVKLTCSYKCLCQLRSSLQMKIASSEESDGWLVGRGVKAMFPLWRVEDGETQGPQLHPAAGCSGEGRGQIHGWTDGCLQKNTTYQYCGRCLIKTPLPFLKSCR